MRYVTLKLFIGILCFLFSFVADRESPLRNLQATLERIKRHDKLRMERMEELIVQRTQQLKDHESGHRRLSEDVRIKKGDVVLVVSSSVLAAPSYLIVCFAAWLIMDRIILGSIVKSKPFNESLTRSRA